MSKAKTTDPLNRKFSLQSMRELGEKGIRGKYFAKVSRGTNMVKLEPSIAKVFTNAEAVNAALQSVIEMAKLTNVGRVTKRKSI
jgi:hypothetical protein